MTFQTNTLAAANTAVTDSPIIPPAARVLANYVGGRWVPAQAAGRLDVTNPANGEVLARVPLSGAADVEAAAAAANAALPDWRGRSVGERTEFIFALREKFRQRIDELAESITREGGKVLSDARAEITRSIEVLEVACASPMTMQGRILEGVARGINTETIRQPVGVCAAITPFNFPAMVPMWFLPFAIVCGNTFVLKPSEQVPLTVGTDLPHSGRNRPAAWRRQSGAWRARCRERDSRQSRDQRGFLRGLGQHREIHLPARGRKRKARAGAGRREKLHGRDARCGG